MDVTDMRVQHLTELLESERRTVKLLSQFSHVDLGEGVSVRAEPEVVSGKPGDYEGMPVLENMMEGQPEAKKVSAADVYNKSWSVDRVLNPV
jgi:hypothetical protein